MVDEKVMEMLANEIDQLDFPNNEFERLQYREKFFMLCDMFRVLPTDYENWIIDQLDKLFRKEKIEKNMII